MMADQFNSPFNAVYHIARLNHWKAVVEEQFPLLLANRNLHEIHVSIACESDAGQNEVLDLLQKMASKRGSEVGMRWYRSRLHDFEHMAMILVDTLAHAQAGPILYFHAKGVSYDPPSRNMEIHRRHINQIVIEADQWAEFLIHSEFEACGPLLTHDERTGARYFGGNFWMARTEYLKKLPPYREFAATAAYGKKSWARHHAEIAVNRTGQMKAHSLDGALLTQKTLATYMTNRYGSSQTIPTSPSGGFTDITLIGGPESEPPSPPSSESPPAPRHP